MVLNIHLLAQPVQLLWRAANFWLGKLRQIHPGKPRDPIQISPIFEIFLDIPQIDKDTAGPQGQAIFQRFLQRLEGRRGEKSAASEFLHGAIAGPGWNQAAALHANRKSKIE